MYDLIGKISTDIPILVSHTALEGGFVGRLIVHDDDDDSDE